MNLIYRSKNLTHLKKSSNVSRRTRMALHFVCLLRIMQPSKENIYSFGEGLIFSVFFFKKWHDNWTELAPEGATAHKIMRHFNHPVKVRKIHYQVVERKQLAEISSRADRFQSLVLHSLYARVVPGTTEERALLQCQGQERQLSLSGWLPLTAIPNISGFASLAQMT